MLTKFDLAGQDNQRILHSALPRYLNKLIDSPIVIIYTLSTEQRKTLFVKLSSRGQSVIEYASIIILIMLGMLIGKIVIDRGAKAGIKNLTDSIEDSDLEILKQGGSGGYNLPDCDCTPWNALGCGPLGGCSAIELYETRTCDPLGCAAQYGILTERCTSSGSCCTQPLLVTGNPNTDCGVNAASYGNPPNGPGAGGCPDDAGWSTWQCGGEPLPPPQFGCRYDFQNPSTCWFRCGEAGPPLHPCATPCFPPPSASPCIPPGCTFQGDHAGLTQDTAWTLTTGSCAGATKCKATCTPGLIPSGSNCVCGPNMSPNGACICKCDVGYIFNTPSCGNGNCHQGSCAANRCASSN